MDSNPQTALQAIICHAAELPLDTAQSQQLFELAGPVEEGEASPYDLAQRRIGLAICDLRKAAREIKALRRHTHDWTPDDLCRICRADGRA